MIPRYTTAEMAEIWSDAHRLQTWLRVEVESAAAWEREGAVPSGVAARLRTRLGTVDYALLAQRAAEIEQTTQHDVIAFLGACEEQLGDDARHLHFGMTSSDVVDSAFAVQIQEAGAVLLSALDDVLGALKRRALQYQRTPCLGRTHGQAAEPTTFGLKLLSFYAEFRRDRARVVAALDDVRAGKLSGAVGNYGHIPPAVERQTLDALGLRVEDIATQVVPRDRHAALFAALAITAGAVERFAVEVRHLQRSEVREAFEPFGKGQRGSSAMPHKKNPILSENLTGLARLVRSYAGAAFENVALWHERDISHSSVERVIAPDATTALHFSLRRLVRLVDGLVVDEAAMRRHLNAAGDVVASGGILLALVKKGVMRQEAYGWVQRCALATVTDPNGAPLRERLKADADVARHLDGAAIDTLCALESQLQHVDAIFARVLA